MFILGGAAGDGGGVCWGGGRGRGAGWWGCMYDVLESFYGSPPNTLNFSSTKSPVSKPTPMIHDMIPALSSENTVPLATPTSSFHSPSFANKKTQKDTRMFFSSHYFWCRAAMKRSLKKITG